MPIIFGPLPVAWCPPVQPTHDAIGMVVDDKTNSARLLLTYPAIAAPASAAELVAEPQSAHLNLNDVTGHSVVSLPANRR